MALAQRKTKAITEFGDFQTPLSLALAATKILCRLGISPESILEPTCGKGTFLSAAARSFPQASSLIGVDINPHYTEIAARELHSYNRGIRAEIRQGDFFSFEWESVFEKHKGPWLILGNPPWVTSSNLGALESNNMPTKSNFQGRSGIEAVTGKSNFDISEWMILRYLDWLKGGGTIAVLCKTSVARKILIHAWKRHIVSFSRMYKIDAMAHFAAAVDACLFVMSLAPHSSNASCDIFESLQASESSGSIELCKGHLVSNKPTFDRLEALLGPDPHYVWRSGIKHDCARVMELFLKGEGYVNGLGEHVQLERTFLYPLLKGSDVGNARTRPRGVMLVTQEMVGRETDRIAHAAPATWEYLNRHCSLLDKRGSVIYKNSPRFSIFGVGPYTFAPWKVAVSSFYKKLMFLPVGPVDDRPIVFDDTVYFLPCSCEKEARFLEELLHSELAQDFYKSMIHWSDKRPLTIDILKRLNIQKLAAALGRDQEYLEFAERMQIAEQESQFCLAF